jgi:hypothetical protein
MVKLFACVTGVTQVPSYAIDVSVGNKDFTMGCRVIFLLQISPSPLFIVPLLKSTPSRLAAIALDSSASFL